MSDSMFKEGGPYNTRRIGRDKYELTIPIPSDADGLVGRECSNSICSPGFFKVMLGTGITEGQEVAYCPYCRYENEPGDFFTKAQKDYAMKLLKNEAIKGINHMVQKTLGLGASGRKKIGNGMISLEMTFKPSRPQHVSRPFEEELRRDVTCPICGLVHSVFGLAIWCPDCGADIFISHVEAELMVVSKVLGAVDARRMELGPRVAARDVENALEDIVSVFETVLKTITRRHLSKTGVPPGEADKSIGKIRNGYQNIAKAINIFYAHTGLELFKDVSDEDVQSLELTFEKRHPITHNLGIIDRKYLERVRTGEVVGREVRVSEAEVEQALIISLNVIRGAYKRINDPT